MQLPVGWAQEADSAHAVENAYSAPLQSPLFLHKKELKPSAYTAPYSAFKNNFDSRQFWKSTGVLLGYSVASMVVLFCLPEDVTAWDLSEANPKGWAKNWPENVWYKGPERDSDILWINATHAYAGIAYYNAARGSGLNIPLSFAYTVFFSTCVWEMGMEAMMEPPSWQDLIGTPLYGMVFGEALYIAKRAIVANDYEVLNSKALGFTLAFLCDPANELAYYLSGGHYKQSDHLTLQFSPINFSLSIKF
ncbi:hypothetical protein AGMMS4956_03860 [Bacteroidia bacterium]|nr:hypothetical protein AGMMS4956_03860 [Bacteroidia bacterium]